VLEILCTYSDAETWEEQRAALGESAGWHRISWFVPSLWQLRSQGHGARGLFCVGRVCH
jgi:hypothetical protein